MSLYSVDNLMAYWSLRAITITSIKDSVEWRFVGVALKKTPGRAIPEVSRALQRLEGIESHYLM